VYSTRFKILAAVLLVANLTVLPAGTVLGLAVGFAGGWIMRRAALPAAGLYPIAVVCLALGAYAAGQWLNVSGFAAVYVAALVLGNFALPHKVAIRSFAEGLAWLSQIGLFVMLGLLLAPERLTWETVGVALVAGLVLTFVARPLSVVASAVFQPLPWRELAFLSWAGLRGAVPIVLCTIPLAGGIEGADRLFDIVFMLVVIYTLATAPSLPFAARWLGVAARAEPRTFDLDAAPLDRIAADLLQVRITAGSRLHGVEVWELRLPPGASVSLIVRDGTTMVPEWSTVLKRGDDFLVVTPRDHREATERRLRAVSARGHLAQWLRPPKRPAE
jgi:cell volume regulation protein A